MVVVAVQGAPVSLSPLQAAVALLQFTLTFREAESFKIMDIQSEPSAASSITIRNAIIMTIGYIILGILSVLQHSKKPGYRLRGEYFSFSPNLS